MQDSIVEEVTIEKIAKEKSNYEIDILKISEKIVTQKLLDIKAKKLTLADPSNYMRPNLAGQIITFEFKKVPKQGVILSSLILSFLLSIFIVSLRYAYINNIAINKS